MSFFGAQQGYCVHQACLLDSCIHKLADWTEMYSIGKMLNPGTHFRAATALEPCPQCDRVCSTHSLLPIKARSGMTGPNVAQESNTREYAYIFSAVMYAVVMQYACWCSAEVHRHPTAWPPTRMSQRPTNDNSKVLFPVVYPVIRESILFVFMVLSARPHLSTPRTNKRSGPYCSLMFLCNHKPVPEATHT